MKNNKIEEIKDEALPPHILKSRNRLIRLYNALRRNKIKGGWREVARQRGSTNQQYIYNFAMHGIEPANENERIACYLQKPAKPENPYRILPRWYKRTPQSLEYYSRMREQIKEMSKMTRQRERG